MNLRTLILAIANFVAVSLAASADNLRSYDTRYYTLHTDLDQDAVREASLRIDAMAQAYLDRTKSFGGRISQRMPFYLFSSPRDYYAAGGMEGTAGVFDGRKLMAIAGKKTGGETWRVVQHEGFHQFAAGCLGRDLPTWANEGLAEYFGEAIFTGDGLVTGVIPPERLARVQHWIKEGNTISIEAMMKKSHDDWNMQLSIVNYDQAWSMVQFLAHGDNGKYQKAFADFLSAVSADKSWTDSWAASFGYDVAPFQKRWRDYWSKLEPDATNEQVAKATTITLTHFYARAFSQRQIFETMDAFLDAAKDGKLKSAARDWLPPGLLQAALGRMERLGQWSIIKRPGGYAVVCQLPDGRKITGTFTVDAGAVRPGSVQAQISAK